MHYIQDVIPLENFHLKVIFRDGTVKVFDAKPYLTGEVFEPINDPAYFVRVDVDEISGSIFWPNGADFCPDFVYDLPDMMVEPKNKLQSFGEAYTESFDFAQDKPTVSNLKWSPMSLVNYSAEDGVATIELNVPPANSYNLDVLRELDAAIVQARGDEGVHVIVLRGAGDRFFCAGADIKFFAGAGPQARYNFALFANETFNRLEWTPKLTIAALNGTALGGGLEMAMACDLRLAKRGERIQLGLPESNLGLLPGTGGTQRLPRLIGKARALEMMITGKAISPDEALNFGLVNQVYAAESFDDDVMKYAQQFLPPNRASKAVGAIKRAVQTGMNLSVADGIAVERELLQQLFESADANEGITAFIEKRKPNYKGQ